MVGLIAPKSTAGQQRVYTGLQIQTSAQGVAVPVYYGTSRETVNLIWYKNFHALQTGTGGKGGLAGSAGKGTGNQYAYYADVILGVSEGPIEGFGQAWSSKNPTTTAAIGLTAFLGTYPQAIWGYVSSFYPTEGRPYNGLAYLAGASYQLGSAAELPQHTLEVYGFFSQRSVYTVTTIPAAGPFTVTVGARTWADGSVNSMWVANVAIPGYTQVGGAPGLLQYSVAAGVYTFNAGNAGAAITIQWTGKGQDADPSLVGNDILTAAKYGLGYPSAQVGELQVATHTAAIPGGLTIAVTHAATFDDNLSVWVSASDTLFTCVASAPGPLEYSYAAGVYTFNAADVGKTVDIAYSWNAAFATYQSYVLAAGFYVSPGYRTQRPGAEALDEIARFTNSDIVISAGSIKFVPRGDTALSGNGATYTPPSVVADFTDDDFIANQVSGGGSGAVSSDDPVILSRKRVSDQKNVAQVECIDRSNQYNSAVVEATDQAMVDQFGRRTTGSLPGHLFCDTTIAKQSAQLLLQRQGIRNTYSFVLPETRIYLDPADLVTLTDAYLGLSSADTQRITAIEEQEDGTIHVLVEEYATGVGNAGAYAFSQGAGYAPNYNVDPGDINEPVLVEPAVEIATNTGLELWAAISGADANWGGADIYVSSDGITYNFIGRKWGPSRQGILSTSFGKSGAVPVAAFSTPYRSPVGFRSNNQSLGRLISAGVGVPAAEFPNIVRRPLRIVSESVVGPVFPGGADPDTTDTLSVDLTMSFGALVSGTVADADAGNTLCIVGSEMIAFSNVTLTAPYNYDLDTYIRRGLYRTQLQAHQTGDKFARLDQTIFVIPLDKTQIAQTIYIKAASFNIYGGGLQDLSVVTPYAYTFTGPPTPGTITGFTAAQNGLAVYLSWTDLDDQSVKGYDILYGAQSGNVATATLLTTASRTTETTTVQVGAGDWRFYIRARNIADQLGPVTTVQISISVFVQTFSTAGTFLWTKPNGVTGSAMALIECWGGGSGGGSGSTVRGGGGGGAYNYRWVPVASLASAEGVIVGAASAVGAAGNFSVFGAWVTAWGGGVGEAAATFAGGGGGGGQTSAGTNGGFNGLGGTGGGPAGGTSATSAPSGGGGGQSQGGTPVDAGGGLFGGGGGGAAGAGGTSRNGGGSLAGGGGGSASDGGTGGGSTLGGAGGGPAVAGTAPGGGGGGGAGGARGQVRITIIP